MEIGLFIEKKMREQGLNKAKLYELMTKAFGPDEFKMAYNTFSNKFATNGFSAIELIQISTLINLDLNYIKEIVYSKNKRSIINLLEEMKYQVSVNETQYSLIIKNSFNIPAELHSIDLSKSKYGHITNPKKDVFVLVFYNDGEAQLSVEEFDFNKNTVRLIAKDEVDFEFYSKVQDILDLADTVIERTSDYYLLYPVEKNIID